MQTIAHKKIKSTNKSPEIGRFVEFLNENRMKAADFAESIDVPERTITKFIWNDTPLSGAILRKLLTVHGVSVDWILTGKGGMYMDSNSITEKPAGYGAMQGEKRLINRQSIRDNSNLSDVYGMFAAVIEQSLIDSGAEAEKDYTYLDLYRLAQPHVLEEAQKTELKGVVFSPISSE